MIEEMCETKLLYIGENLFGVLKCLPFNRLDTPPIVLSDIQNARIIDRDVSENIHLTIIGLSRQRTISTDETSHPPVAQTSNQLDETNSNTDIKPNTPVKTDPDGTIPLSVFGDAYADLIATKAEPNEVAPELEIADVRTLGMIIKPEDDKWSDTIRITNPRCAVHGIHAQMSTEQSQMSAPQQDPHPDPPASVPPYSTSLLMNRGMTTIDIVPINTHTDLDTLQEATSTPNVDTLPDATSCSKEVSPADSQSEATAVQDVINLISA